MYFTLILVCGKAEGGENQINEHNIISELDFLFVNNPISLISSRVGSLKICNYSAKKKDWNLLTCKLLGT